ncbi:MAG: aminoglycoside phosphotransferase family protein [Myxococcales bacterium]|nr:aminoglycoside phosphotransferase family protein [Myxococcales bacterium]MDH5306310.1 aminoglycoside phosphotransferase family protein [Myxococcales bacterium]MDH5567145.1 aminoglycoside phosphotransferase family protein [Myxococcales bacterium]
MSKRAAQLARPFEIPGTLCSVAALGSGHIHDTFLAEYEHRGKRTRFVHQRLNTRIFRDPAGLMQNVVRVTEHLRSALRARGSAEVERRCLRVIHCADGRPFHVDAEEGVWRTTGYVERAHSVDSVDRPERAGEAARAFGAFAADLADLDPAEVLETLPGFHALEGRIAALEEAARADPRGRAAGVGPELRQLRAARATVARELDARSFARAPRRVVHNDCKINNVLFDDASGEGICVIDLDTVMEGTLLCDFGDLVRSAAGPAPEDEPDLSRVRFDLALFRALARGYRAGVGSLLTPTERRLLAIAGPALTLENAARFLTDHLRGDVYFRIHRPEHNLDRCRAQLRLLDHMLASLDAADRIVDEIPD